MEHSFSGLRVSDSWKTLISYRQSKHQAERITSSWAKVIFYYHSTCSNDQTNHKTLLQWGHQALSRLCRSTLFLNSFLTGGPALPWMILWNPVFTKRPTRSKVRVQRGCSELTTYSQDLRVMCSRVTRKNSQSTRCRNHSAIWIR